MQLNSARLNEEPGAALCPENHQQDEHKKMPMLSIGVLNELIEHRCAPRPARKRAQVPYELFRLFKL